MYSIEIVVLFEKDTLDQTIYYIWLIFRYSTMSKTPYLLAGALHRFFFSAATSYPEQLVQLEVIHKTCG